MKELQTKSIKYIFWDWDGTLCLQQYFWPQSRQDNKEIKKLDSIWQAGKSTDWMRGKYSLEQLRQECDCELSDIELTQILINEWPDETTINKPLFSIVCALFQNASHYLVTDNMDIFNGYATQSHFLQQNITKIYNSCDYHCLKNDEQSLFQTIRKDLRLDFSDVLLIDDSADTCKRFISMGGNAINIDRNKRL